MTTGTPRDRVYLELFSQLLANEDRAMPTGAIVPDMIEKVDADEETVRGVLEALADAGVLVERTERGHLPDQDETCSVYYTAEDGPLGPVGAITPVKDIHEEYDDETLEEISEELGL
jgi:hypothetical protein